MEEYIYLQIGFRVLNHLYTKSAIADILKLPNITENDTDYKETRLHLRNHTNAHQVGQLFTGPWQYESSA